MSNKLEINTIVITDLNSLQDYYNQLAAAFGTIQSISIQLNELKARVNVDATGNQDNYTIDDVAGIQTVIDYKNTEVGKL